MSDDIVIRAEGLGKKYVIGHQSNERSTTLRDVIVRTTKSFARGAGEMLRGKPIYAGDDLEEFWALKDVNFEIKRGDVVGIIGRNGAGKSTLLKVLSRITEPTEGRVEIRGRVASLLEVGTGFHPELSGRENIYLNGAILGMARHEIRRKFDEIVDFSGVEKFLDTPVKRYSSGMYVRLAFAVAAHLEPEILIIDEVLAVGDAEFQKKCLGKMQDVANHGRTVLFVSHQIPAVRSLCSRCIFLKNGTISLDGRTDTVVSKYLGVDEQRTSGFCNGGRHFTAVDGAIETARVTVNGTIQAAVESGAPFSVEVVSRVKSGTNYSVEILLKDQHSNPVAFWPGGLLQDFKAVGNSEQQVVCINVQSLALAEGTYSIDIMLAEAGVRFIDYVENALELQVLGVGRGERMWVFKQAAGQGSILLNADCEMQ